MITLKLTHGLSHDNGYVSATQKHPYVTVEDEAIAQYCIDSGFFARVDAKSAVPASPDAPDGEQAITTPAATGSEDTSPDGSADDADELETMTVSELKAYAETVGIDLGKATKKADIIAIIREEEAKA